MTTSEPVVAFSSPITRAHHLHVLILSIKSEGTWKVRYDMVILCHFLSLISVHVIRMGEWVASTSSHEAGNASQPRERHCTVSRPIDESKSTLTAVLCPRNTRGLSVIQ